MQLRKDSVSLQSTSQHFSFIFDTRWILNLQKNSANANTTAANRNKLPRW